MKRVYQEEYDNFEKMIRDVERELADLRLYKGKVAIHQGDNWHDNPVLYQTELKEKYLMAKLHNLKQEFLQYEVIKERTNEMISEKEILNPNLIKDDNISDEEKERIRALHNQIVRGSIYKKQIVSLSDSESLEKLLLYKIAFTSIVSNNKIDPKSFMIILPDKETKEKISKYMTYYVPDSIPLFTIDDFAKDYLNEKISVINDDDSQVKRSLINKEKLDNFIKQYFEKYMISDDIRILDEVVFTEEDVRNALFSSSKNLPNYNWACMYLTNKFKSSQDSIVNQVTEKYYSKMRTLPVNSDERKEYLSKINEIRKTFKEKGIKIIKDYFKKLNKKRTEIYTIFISTLNIEPSDSKLLKMQSDTLKNLKKHKMTYMDLYATFYINYYLDKKSIDTSHAFIYGIPVLDEFQLSVWDDLIKEVGYTIFNFSNQIELGKDDYEIYDLNIRKDDSKKIILKNPDLKGHQ